MPVDVDVRIVLGHDTAKRRRNLVSDSDGEPASEAATVAVTWLVVLWMRWG
jgi:hypothetical protein